MFEASLGGATFPINSEQAEQLIDQLKNDIRSTLKNIRNKKLDDVYKEAKNEGRKQDEKREAISEPISRIIAKEQSLLRHIFGISAAIVFVASVGFSLVVAITSDTATLEKVVQISKDMALPFVSVVLGFYFGATAKSK